MYTVIAPKPLPNVPHPIPYQGSKRLLAPLIVSLFPNHVTRLVEPFAGSAAVSLAAAQMGRVNDFFINDTDQPLIHLWNEIIHNPEDIASKYQSIWQAQMGDERAYYDCVRSRFNQYRRPEDFLFLLSRCVKAAIRYNSCGEFINSPDNRRLGAKPETVRRRIMDASRLLGGKTSVSTLDYREVLKHVRANDIVYMDPPYQGVGNSRYRKSIVFSEFVDALRELRSNQISFIISYDGRTGFKQHGQKLPESLDLTHMEVLVGRSTQATLLGRNENTYESLYVSFPVESITSSL